MRNTPFFALILSATFGVSSPAALVWSIDAGTPMTAGMVVDGTYTGTYVDDTDATITGTWTLDLDHTPGGAPSDIDMTFRGFGGFVGGASGATIGPSGTGFGVYFTSGAGGSPDDTLDFTFTVTGSATHTLLSTGVISQAGGGAGWGHLEVDAGGTFSNPDGDDVTFTPGGFPPLDAIEYGPADSMPHLDTWYHTYDVLSFSGTVVDPRSNDHLVFGAAVVIPEPSRLLLLAIAIIPLLSRRRR